MPQEALEWKDAQAEGARVEREASDADWESRLEEAVSSAHKWTEFANRLESEKAQAESQLSATLVHLQVCALIRSQTLDALSQRPVLSFRRKRQHSAKRPWPWLGEVLGLSA